MYYVLVYLNFVSLLEFRLRVQEMCSLRAMNFILLLVYFLLFRCSASIWIFSIVALFINLLFILKEFAFLYMQANNKKCNTFLFLFNKIMCSIANGHVRVLETGRPSHIEFKFRICINFLCRWTLYLYK